MVVARYRSDLRPSTANTYTDSSFALMLWEDGVDEAELVVGEQEGVGRCAEQAAGTAVDDGFRCFAGLDGFVGQETRDEVFRLAVDGGEADDPVAGADARAAGAVQRDEERVGERGVVGGEPGEAERRGVGGES